MKSQLPPELIEAIIVAGLDDAGAGAARYALDERRLGRRRAAFLSTCALVSVVWHAFATPLLYQRLVLDDATDDEMRSDDQPKDVVPQALRSDRRRALLRHLQTRPDLCALVRELDHPVGAADQHAPLFWALARTLRRSPVLATLSILPLPSKTKPALPLPVPLTTLAVSSRFSPIRAPLARLADWVADLTTLTRLDISTSGEAHSLRPMLDGARLPNLTDLRITSDQRRDDSGHVEAVLRLYGLQLRTLHLFDLSGRRPHTPDIRSLCPALEELALDYLRPLPMARRSGTVVRPPALGDFELLLFGSPWRRPSDNASPASAAVLSRALQQDSLAAACSLRPRRVSLAELDLQGCSDVDRASARELAHDMLKRAGGARLEDRFGQVVEGTESAEETA